MFTSASDLLLEAPPDYWSAGWQADRKSSYALTAGQQRAGGDLGGKESGRDMQLNGRRRMNGGVGNMGRMRQIGRGGRNRMKRVVIVKDLLSLESMGRLVTICSTQSD